MPRIELEGVSKAVAGPVPALADLDLAVADGAILAVLGPSGSGKTTLLRLIAGLDRPSSGRVAFDGKDLAKVSPRTRDVAMVFQNQAPFPHLDVAANLAFGARARRVPGPQVADRVETAAGLLGIAHLLRRMPATLSGGERQRVALGRAIVRGPAVLLLDEPFSNLDAPLRLALRAALRDAHRLMETTTVFVTHDQQEAIAIGDRVAVLDRGRLAQEGRAEDLLDRPASLFVAGFLGDPPMGTLAAEVVREDGHWQVRIEGAEGGTVAVPETGWGEAIRRVGPGLYRLGLGINAVQAEVPDGPSFRLSTIENRGKGRIARLHGGPWVALPASGGFREGDLLQVGLDLDAACWFDPATSRRLP